MLLSHMWKDTGRFTEIKLPRKLSDFVPVTGPLSWNLEHILSERLIEIIICYFNSARPRFGLVSLPGCIDVRNISLDLFSV
jgi:hypothetical protein